MRKRVLCVLLALGVLFGLVPELAAASTIIVLDREEDRPYFEDDNLDDTDIDGEEDNSKGQSEDIKENYVVVTYDPNGGSGYMADETAIVGVPFALPACDFNAPNDMEFQAWEVDGQFFSARDICVFEADTSVKATWKSVYEAALSVEIDISQIKPGLLGYPYSGRFHAIGIGEDTSVIFELTSGQMPPGLSLSENGEVTGTPTSTGDFEFHVTVTAESNGTYQTDDCDVSIGISELVFSSNPGPRMPNEAGSPPIINRSQTLDGESENDSDSTAVVPDGSSDIPDIAPGSSAITNRSETLDDNDNDTPQGGAGSPRITGRTETLDDSEDVTDATNGISAFMDRSETWDNNKKTAVTSPKLTIISETLDAFTDISPSLWCYGDLKWAFNNHYMNGVTSTLFHPQDNISSVTAVVVLARMDGVDLSRYEGRTFSGIQTGQWYTSAANWARDKGLLPSGTFTGNRPLPRGQLAVMLVKYLRSTGIRYAQSSRPVNFADAASMTQEENEAFQILYRLGIFKGTGNYTMNSKGYTTRGHLAAVLHRLSIFMG